MAALQVKGKKVRIDSIASLEAIAAAIADADYPVMASVAV